MNKKTAEKVLKKIEVEIAEGRYLNVKKNASIKFKIFWKSFIGFIVSV